MKWHIPCKTFLFGEYAALRQQSAVLITTSPCFIIEKTTAKELNGIHPDSPAGKYWHKNAKHHYGLRFYDPLQGIGGLGASSAQFIGAWMAQNTDSPKLDIEKQQRMLEDYWHFAWNGHGNKPSGYDVLAQSSQQCVYINNTKQQPSEIAWPFKDLSLLLVHSGNKLATHLHLQDAIIPEDCYATLSDSADKGWSAIRTADAQRFIAAVNKARETLESYQLLASQSQFLMKKFEDFSFVYALKGCGAMGADIIALVIDAAAIAKAVQKIEQLGMRIIATNKDIYKKNALF